MTGFVEDCDMSESEMISVECIDLEQGLDGIMKVLLTFSLTWW
jgi:hypothetical protein